MFLIKMLSAPMSRRPVGLRRLARIVATTSAPSSSSGGAAGRHGRGVVAAARTAARLVTVYRADHLDAVSTLAGPDGASRDPFRPSPASRPSTVVCRLVVRRVDHSQPLASPWAVWGAVSTRISLTEIGEVASIATRREGNGSRPKLVIRSALASPRDLTWRPRDSASARPACVSPRHNDAHRLATSTASGSIRGRSPAAPLRAPGSPKRLAAARGSFPGAFRQANSASTSVMVPSVPPRHRRGVR